MEKGKKRIKREYSAGGVVYRKLKLNPFDKLRSSTPRTLTVSSVEPLLRSSIPRSLRFEELEEVNTEQSRSIKSAKLKVEWLITQPSAKDEPWRQSRWQLPKGWIDEGETGQQAAIREVKEEGGIEAEIIDKIGRINIFFYNEDKQKVVKNIVFFLMKYKAGSEKDHDREIKEAVWLPFQEAHERLTFKSEKGILEKAKKILEEKEKQPSLL